MLYVYYSIYYFLYYFIHYLILSCYNYIISYFNITLWRERTKCKWKWLFEFHTLYLWLSSTNSLLSWHQFREQNIVFIKNKRKQNIFVSPELSSVRDYVITHSVRVCMYVVICKIDHCIHIHWCIPMGLWHNDPWVESHMWPQQTWGQRSSRGQWPLVQVFGKKGQCIHILWCIFKSNITMIA